MFLISGLALGLGNAGAGLSNAVQQYRENEFRYRQQKQQEELTAQQLKRAELENEKAAEELKAGNILAAYPIAGGLQVYRMTPDGQIHAQTVIGDTHALGQQTVALKGLLDTIKDPEKRQEASSLWDLTYASTRDPAKATQSVAHLIETWKEPKASSLTALEAQAAQDLVGKVNPKTRQPYTLVEAIKEIKESTPTGSQAIKINTVGGIPSSISGPQGTFALNSPSLPDSYKPIAQAALASHRQAQSEKVQDEARRSKLASDREMNSLFGLLTLPGSTGAKTTKKPGSSPLTGKDFLKTLPEKVSSLVEQIGTGKMPLERYGYILTRNPALMTMVAQAYPDFDGSKVQSYITTVHDFTSGKTAIALNAGATALKHMEELKELNTIESRVPGTKDNKAFENKLNTVVGELVRFYQMPSTNQSYKEMRGTLGGIFNRDAAISSQASSMADKLASYARQWQNAAPSSAYEAPMPHIDERAKSALQKLDPDFNQDYPNLAAQFTPKGSRSKGGTAKRIKVVSPSGQVGTIPASQLTEAIREGYRVTSR